MEYVVNSVNISSHAVDLNSKQEDYIRKLIRSNEFILNLLKHFWYTKFCIRYALLYNKRFYKCKSHRYYLQSTEMLTTLLVEVSFEFINAL